MTFPYMSLPAAFLTLVPLYEPLPWPFSCLARFPESPTLTHVLPWGSMLKPFQERVSLSPNLRFYCWPGEVA